MSSLMKPEGLKPAGIEARTIHASGKDVRGNSAAGKSSELHIFDLPRGGAPWAEAETFHRTAGRIAYSNG